MKTSLKVLAVAMAMTFGGGAANAAIVNNNTYTTDEASGLDWLDVTATKNQSWNTVNGRLSTDLLGWQFATRTETNQLWENATGVIPSVNAPTGTSNAASLNLRTWLGFTTNDYVHGLTADVQSVNSHYSVMMNASQYDNRDGLYELNTAVWSDMGSFLVRNTAVATPIPAALFMFASGVLGLFGYENRRKKRSLSQTASV